MANVKVTLWYAGENEAFADSRALVVHLLILHSDVFKQSRGQQVDVTWFFCIYFEDEEALLVRSLPQYIILANRTALKESLKDFSILIFIFQ